MKFLQPLTGRNKNPMAKRKRKIRLQWPLGGLDKSGAFRNQPPFSTNDCQNVIPRGSLEERARGGSRPGVGKAYEDQLGTVGNRKIRMLAPVTVVRHDGFTQWYDTFDGSAMGDAWTAEAWDADGLPSILPNELSSSSYAADVGGVANALTIDNTSAYEFGMFISPYDGEHQGTYQLYGAMNDTTPALLTDGFNADITMTGVTGTYSGTLTVYNATTPTVFTFTPGTADLGYAPSGWFKVLYTAGTPNVKVYWNGTLILDQDITLGGNAGDRFGFGMECTEEDGYCLADSFRVQYYTGDLRERRRNILVASAGEKLYSEGFAGQMEEVSTSLTIQSDRRIDAQQRLQKLYIADHGNPVRDTGVTISGTTVTQSDITTSTATAVDDMIVISAGTGTVTDGLYTIAAVGAGSLTLGSAAGTGTATIRVERAPKVYDPSTDALTLLTATEGQYPLGCDLICVYRDRLCLGLDNVMYHSRQGTMTDWDFGITASDPGRAISTTAADAGDVGDMLTAMIPHTDDYLIMGCKSSLWMLEGDLAYDGEINRISGNTSVIMRGAWCRAEGGGVYFVGNDGLNYLPPGGRPYPENLSQFKLPKELRDINTDIYQVSMSYDMRRHLVHIYLSPENPTGRKHWIFSAVHKSFWPVVGNTDHDAMNIIPMNSDYMPSVSVVVGCRDGYIRYFNESFETDDGSEIVDYIDIGPFNLAGDYNAGGLDEIIGTLGQNSGDVTWEVRVGTDFNTVAISSSNFATGTWSSGKSYVSHVRAYGKAAVVRLKAKDSDRAWAFEQIIANLATCGEDRDF